MSMPLNRDGNLAKSPEGLMSIAFPIEGLQPEITEQFTTQAKQDGQRYALLGRSGIAIAAGMGVSQTSRPAIIENDLMYIPNELHVYNSTGSTYEEVILESLDEVNDGEELIIEGSHIAFGRLESTGERSLIQPDELLYLAAKKYIFAGDSSNYRILESGIAVPLAPWELRRLPNLTASAQELVRMSQGGRRVALAMMYAHERRAEDNFNDWTVATTLFGTGPFDSKVVGIRTDQGILCQDSGAAWLHAGRSMGNDSSLAQELVGHQVEVFKDDDADYKWAGAEAIIEIYKRSKPTPKSSYLENYWRSLTLNQRESIHLNGHNLMDVVRPIVRPLIESVLGANHAVVLTSKRLTELKWHAGMTEDSRALNIVEAVTNIDPTNSSDDPADLFGQMQAELEQVGNDPHIIATNPLEPAYIAHILQASSPDMIIVLNKSGEIRDTDDNGEIELLSSIGKIVCLYGPDGLQLLDQKTDSI
jgi:hypothetical protein